jgi:hypothetical protein
MIGGESCPLCRLMMAASWGKNHYVPHFACYRCERVYVREAGVLVECLSPKEHMQNPPDWLLRKAPLGAAPPAPDTPTAKGFK